MTNKTKANRPLKETNLGGWIAFVAVLLVLSLGASPYHKLADSVMIAVRLSLVLVLSGLVVWERWNHRKDLPGGRGNPYDRGESFLQRMRRWYYGESSKD